MRVQPLSRAHILQQFQLHCQFLAASANRTFKQEFEELNDVGKDLSSRVGSLEHNREKNRYPTILPYDHCRVRLSLQDHQPHSDYINASFVPGGGTERDFICTQGPLRSTMADFWRMLWEQNVSVIVMVTATRHKDTMLCDQYWPLEHGSVWHGSILVTTLSRKQGPHYFITTINVRQRGCSTDRTVTHYHYPAWPDQGVPKDPTSLCALAEIVRKHLDASQRLGPAVVHCSAGVGRSGVFVALLWLTQLCARGIQPDIRATVEDLRRHRMWMVQTLEQYILVHQCLLHWLRRGSQGISARPQEQAAVPNNAAPQQRSSQERRSGRGGGAGRARRSGRHQSQQPSPPQIQSSLQSILNPGRQQSQQPSTQLQQLQSIMNPARRQSQQPSPQIQSALQSLLNPGNLLRRLMPSSSSSNHVHFGPHSHT